jgi:serine palmitoyltransferase
MMGTFTKSFGAAGGYISGSKTIINYLRKHSHAHLYASSMAPGVCAQILGTIDQLENEIGQNRIKCLMENTDYFRSRLMEMGFIVYGNKHSPVVPMMIYMPSKMLAFSRLMQENGIACVVVGFPATPIVSGRVRFCLSASHSREQLDYVLKTVDRLGDHLALKHSFLNATRQNNFCK